MPTRGPVPVKHYKKETAEVIKLGPLLCYVFEDGSNTDNRVGCVTIELPKGTRGPPMHWHRFHDECFFVTKGWLETLRHPGVICTDRQVQVL